jgi:sugar phosphate isomerase/epimerase
MTRRTFTQTLGLAAAAGRAWSAPYRLKIGVGTYSYHSLSIDDMIVQLNRLNIREIEMSRVEFMLMKPPTPEMCQSARSKFDRAGIRCISYYTATIKNDQDLDYAVQYGKLLGAHNITGDATGDMLRKIDERLTREGLTFGIHNHYFKNEKFPFESADDVLNALKGRSKTMGSTLDVGQMVSCRQDPVGAVRKLGPYLKMVHLKDIAAPGDEVNVLLGRGVAKIPEVMAELHKVNYRGLVAVEYEKEGDVDEDMRQEIEYARKLA